jgi:hypothetical protein
LLQNAALPAADAATQSFLLMFTTTLSTGERVSANAYQFLAQVVF